MVNIPTANEADYGTKPKRDLIFLRIGEIQGYCLITLVLGFEPGGDM
jgi:hypothetical protein